MFSIVDNQLLWNEKVLIQSDTPSLLNLFHEWLLGVWDNAETEDFRFIHLKHLYQIILGSVDTSQPEKLIKYESLRVISCSPYRGYYGLYVLNRYENEVFGWCGLALSPVCRELEAVVGTRYGSFVPLTSKDETGTQSYFEKIVDLNWMNDDGDDNADFKTS